ncbi:MAG TPA: glycosyltransferase family 39 protein [Terriglobia bacterium]
MRRQSLNAAALLGIWAILLVLHAPLLRLPYYWDEAGYYVPAALDFLRHGLLIPTSTLPTGHTPLVTIYLALAWRAFGFTPLVTRAAMILVAGVTLLVTAALARTVFVKSAWAAKGTVWSAMLLALAPLFFAQSSMAHLDLVVALFTSLAILFLLRERWLLFGAAASLAVLSKETAIVLVPVAWIYRWLDARRAGETPATIWLWLASPCAPLAAWALYYHHHTGFWTGNASYLQYNLYSTLSPVRILLCFLRRLHEVFIAGFSWVITAAALIGAWWSRRHLAEAEKTMVERRFILLTTLLAAAYLLMLSMVGGAILPRYTLPLYPPLIVLALLYVWRLPARVARGCCLLAAACLVAGWFTRPPYPFPFEDNLAYVDFIELHQQAADFLSAYDHGEAGNPRGLRILTAWPASNELTTPDLGYVTDPLPVVPVDGFEAQDFRSVQPGSFDILYLYSRKWEPPGNWLTRFAGLQRVEARYFDYAPQAPAAELAAKFRLRLLARWERRGQWVAIFEADRSEP